MKTAIDQVFDQLAQAGRKAVIPFITAGDPDLEFTATLLDAISDAGAALCELGIPYSDPVADGPVIQASYQRVLEKGTSVAQIAHMLACRPTPQPMPVLWMVGYAIIWKHGLAPFVDQACTSGVSGLIVPDLLLEESAPLRRECRSRGISFIPLVTPTTPPDRAARIAESATGFLYYVSVTGITGTRDELPDELADAVSRLRDKSPVPVCVGFGVSRPDQAAQVAQVADGVIVGSAIVRKIAQVDKTGREETVQEVARFVRALVDAVG